MSHGGFEDREALRAAATRFVETAWRQRDLVALSELVHPDYRHALVGRERDLPFDAYRKFLGTVQDVFEQLVLAVLDTVAEDDEVALHLVLGGRHVKPLFGIAARGAEGRLDVMTRLVFSERRVLRQYSVTDFATLSTRLRRPPRSSRMAPPDGGGT